MAIAAATCESFMAVLLFSWARLTERLHSIRRKRDEKGAKLGREIFFDIRMQGFRLSPNSLTRPEEELRAT
jgi:hypothetical protein